MHSLGSRIRHVVVTASRQHIVASASVRRTERRVHRPLHLCLLSSEPSNVEVVSVGGKRTAESAAAAAAVVETSTSDAATVAEPTPRALRILAIHSAIPMVGFGFMDNLVMIQAGEAIDLTIGVTFGLSTLTAAGFGQCISDVAGLTTGGVVDAAVSKLNLPSHGLSSEQLCLKSARLYRTAGGCAGVVAGCLLGMCSLLFMDTDKADRLKRAKELTSIFETVMVHGHTLIRAERCSLWMLDRDKNELWSKVATGVVDPMILRIPASSGVVGAAMREEEIVNIHDAYKDDRFNPDVDQITGFRTRSIIAVPVKNDRGKVIGVIQMINKKNEDGTDGVFDIHDAKMMQMLSAHVTTFIKIVTGHED